MTKGKGNLLSVTQQMKIIQTMKNNSKISNTRIKIRNTLPSIGGTNCVTFPLHLPSLPEAYVAHCKW